MKERARLNIEKLGKNDIADERYEFINQYEILKALPQAIIEKDEDLFSKAADDNYMEFLRVREGESHEKPDFTPDGRIITQP
jgi:hypothetical protein